MPSLSFTSKKAPRDQRSAEKDAEQSAFVVAVRDCVLRELSRILVSACQAPCTAMMARIATVCSERKRGKHAQFMRLRRCLFTRLLTLGIDPSGGDILAHGDCTSSVLASEVQPGDRELRR